MTEARSQKTSGDRRRSMETPRYRRLSDCSRGWPRMVKGRRWLRNSVAEGHRETLGLGGVEGHAKAGDCSGEEVQVGLESGGVFRRPRVADEH